MQSKKPTTLLIKNLQRGLFHLIDDVPLRNYVTIFVWGVFVLGIIYFILTPCSHGIGTNGQPLQNLTFWNAQYFSIVTVSSLGYGDMHPMGASKILACVEVLSGLVLMGILLAKTTSARISYNVGRLFSSEIQKRMEGFAKEFENLEDKLRIAISSIGEIQKTPGEKTPKGKSEVIKKCTNIITSLHSNSSAMAEYLSYEVEHCKFFTMAPVEGIKRTADAINTVIGLLGQMIMSTTPEVRSSLFTEKNKHKLLSVTDEHKRISKIVCENCTNDEINRKFSDISRICDDLPASFYAVPSLEETQPDQKLGESFEPQQPI